MDGAVVRLMRQKVPRIVAFPVALFLGVALLLVTRQPAEIARVEDLFEASPPSALSTHPPSSDASPVLPPPSDVALRENLEKSSIQDAIQEDSNQVDGKTTEPSRSSRDSSESTRPDRSTSSEANIENKRNQDGEGEQCWDGRVRVYVHELPRRMNLGLMEPKWKTRQEQRTNGSMDEPPIPAWGWPAGGDVHPTAWQHSLEYFLVADLLQPPSKRDAGVAAVRVSDPAHADVFLVPFFASTMVNLLRRKNFPTYKALAMEMAELMSASPWWQRRGGRDHVLCVTHPNALESVRHHMAAAAFVAVDLARYEPGEADLHKDIIAPYGALVETYTAEAERRDAQGGLAGGGRGGGPAAVAEAEAEAGSRLGMGRDGGGDRETGKDGEEEGGDTGEGEGSDGLHGQVTGGEAGAAGKGAVAGGAAAAAAVDTGGADAGVFARRTTLLYFQGTLQRKDRRKALFDELQGEADVHVREASGSSQSIRDSQEGMRQSRFCLHVEGDTPSSSRFFNAIMSGCVPVVVSDNVELPFESVIDYSRLTLFFSQQDALVKGRLVSALRQVSEQEWLAMWHEVHQVQKHFEFQQPARAGDAVDMVWREVRNRLPSMHLMAHRDTRLTIPDWSA
ncbi:unnamed protein product [Closterium sp. NIES-64]|nr:unnamed protein product [Closterium sp. NIES-64]